MRRVAHWLASTFLSQRQFVWLWLRVIAGNRDFSVVLAKAAIVASLSLTTTPPPPLSNIRKQTHKQDGGLAYFRNADSTGTAKYAQ